MSSGVASIRTSSGLDLMFKFEGGKVVKAAVMTLIPYPYLSSEPRDSEGNPMFYFTGQDFNPTTEQMLLLHSAMCDQSVFDSLNEFEFDGIMYTKIDSEFGHIIRAQRQDGTQSIIVVNTVRGMRMIIGTCAALELSVGVEAHRAELDDLHHQDVWNQMTIPKLQMDQIGIYVPGPYEGSHKLWAGKCAITTGEVYILSGSVMNGGGDGSFKINQELYHVVGRETDQTQNIGIIKAKKDESKSVAVAASDVDGHYFVVAVDEDDVDEVASRVLIATKELQRLHAGEDSIEHSSEQISTELAEHKQKLEQEHKQEEEPRHGGSAISAAFAGAGQGIAAAVSAQE